MKRIVNNLLKTSALLTLILLAASQTIYAKSKDDEYTIEYNFEEDKYTGPGVKISDSSWNGTKTDRIYGYGNLNGIVGDEVCEFNALSSDGPTNYVEYDDTNPINHYLIDMGPKSVSNSAYSLHFINDGGPGMNVQSNELGKTMVYNDGGPGFTVNGFTVTEKTHVDNGPTVSTAQIKPADFVKLLTMKPGDFTFVGGTREDKIGK